MNVPAADTEHLAVSGEAVEGSGDFFTANIFRENLNAEQQAIYDKGVNIVSGKVSTKITNTNSCLVITRITSVSIDPGEDTFDFPAFTTEQQDDLRALLALFVELKN